MELSTILVAVVVVLLVAWLMRQGRAPGLPPGPPCLPIFGSTLSMTDPMLHQQLLKWRKKYGDVLSFYFGSKPVVAIHGYEAIREALVAHGQNFSGRPPVKDNVRFRSYSPIHPTVGIIDMTMSEEWKRQRSTSLQILRGLGYGKYNTEGKIQEEAAYLMDIFKNLNGKPFDPAPTLMISVSNVICSLLYGRRYEHSDDEYQYLLKTVRELIHLFFEETEGDFVWLYQLKPSYRKVIKDFDACCKKLIAFNQKKIDERRVRIESEDFDEPSDFIEGYLKELQPNSKGERKMAEDWLIAILNDFFLAGAETTSTTLTWAILLMASFPDVQKKVHEELDRVLGRNPVEVTLELRSQCPYTDATLFEIQRISSLVPLALTHATTTDTNFRGFQIEKDTMVLVNLYSVLHDPKVFPEPMSLKPERFLDDEGKATRHEHWVPFSMGRRVCLGEQLARQELFIFFTTLMLHNTIKLPQGATVDLEPDRAGLLKPKPYKVIFEPRL